MDPWDINTQDNRKRITDLVGVLHRLCNGTHDLRTSNIVWKAVRDELSKINRNYADVVIAKGQLEDVK